MKYVCELCGWVYDEEVGDAKNHITPGTRFEDLPKHYECPACFMGKEAFSPVK